MAKKDYEPDMQPIPIRSFNNAFDIQIFGESTKAFLIDWLSLTLVIEIVMLLVGKIYPINLAYQWLWENDYYIVQYVIFPVFVPFVIIKLTKRDGVSFWRWVAILLTDKLSQNRFTPYLEPDLKERMQMKLSGEEE